MPDPTPEQRVAEELAREVWVGYTDEAGDDDGNYGVVDSDGRRTLSKHALNAVRAALTSDDPDVVRAMAVRIGLNVSTRTVYEAARRDSLDTDGQPTVFSFGQDRPWRILEAIRRRELGLSPETHICMGAIQTSASVSMRSPWREVPDAEA